MVDHEHPETITDAVPAADLPERPEPPATWPSVTGVARVDRRTKDLAKRLLPGEIAVIDHEDLDTVATESLLGAGVAAVVNAADCISGRYPNPGPLLLPAAGISVVDGLGVGRDGRRSPTATPSRSSATPWSSATARWPPGTARTPPPSAPCSRRPRSNMGDELQRFAENTLSYIQREGHLLIDDPDIPEIPVDFQGRHVLVVVRGVDYKKDLQLLRRSGYLKEQRPLLIGVDGGADAILELGLTPDVIIGDMDSVSEQALRCGAALVVHGYTDGRAPGAELLDAARRRRTRSSPRPARPRTSPCCSPSSGAPP